MTRSRIFDNVLKALVLSAGLSLGFGLSGVELSSLLPTFFLVAMACVGEWVEVRVGHLGAFTLRPVVAFIALWNGGSALFVLVGLAPIFLFRLPARRSTPREALVLAGGETLAFWLGYAAYLSTQSMTLPSWGLVKPGEVLARSAGFLIYWTVHMILQGINLNLTEGIRFRTALGQLHRSGWTHAAVLAVATVSLSYVGANFGYLLMGMGGVMLVEAYYPWKLLGEQGAVLLTSLQMMAQAVDLKDPYTSNHSQRVSRYAVRLARGMGLPEDEVERIRVGGLMHDIGKIGISGRIIRKPGKLTSEEQALMRRHSSVSAEIIEHLEILGESARMVRHHHENYDGTGYPDGLKGEGIPLGARIIFVGDAFDALVTDRPYRKGASRDEALAVIQKHAGTQFDKAVVDTLQRISDFL